MSRTTNSMSDLFGEVIHTYTRAQAIADGTLIDVTSADAGAREVGIRWPVALSASAYADAVRWDEGEGGNVDPAKGCTGNSTAGRLWDVMSLARHLALGPACKVATVEGSARIDFRVLRIPAEGATTSPSHTRLSLCLGPGDDGEPVITIVLPHED